MTDPSKADVKNTNNFKYVAVGILILVIFVVASVVFATMRHIILADDAVSISLYMQTSMTIIWNLTKTLYPRHTTIYKFFNYVCGFILVLCAVWSFILAFVVLAPSGWAGACKIAFIPTVTLAIGFLQPIYTTHSFKCEYTRQILKYLLIVFYILSFILAGIAS